MNGIITPNQSLQAAQFKGFGDAQVSLKQMQIQAAATNLREFTVRQDYMDIIGDYLMREAPMWNRLVKEPASADLVQEIRTTALPTVGFSDKQDLNSGPPQPTGAARNRNDLTDPGQYVKALSGFIDWSHYARSLAEQQGNPYGDQVAKDSADMLSSAAKELERALWLGDSGSNALEFNGIVQQMPGTNVFTLDLTDAGNETSVGQKLVEGIARICTNRVISRNVTNVVTSGLGLNQLHREVEDRRLITEQAEVTPGVMVPGIRSVKGVVPIEATPYIDDQPGAGVNGGDLVSYYFLNMDHLRWKGVYPMGGQRTFNPQLFEVTNYQSTVPLTESQLVLVYGTLYAMNQGDSIWRLDVTFPAGSAWSYV